MAGCAQMRIHIQNPADDPLFLFTRGMWDAACLRDPDVSTGHEVTIGDSNADFADGIAEAEVLITEVGVVAAQFPCPAPRLKLLFITNAGLDRLAPYDWVPSGVTLLNNAGEPLIHIANQLGHSMTRTTELYSHAFGQSRVGRGEPMEAAILAARRELAGDRVRSVYDLAEFRAARVAR